MKKTWVLLAVLVWFGQEVVGQDRMTPELLWELGRVGGQTLSPDGKYAVYSVRTYDLNGNRGSSDLFRIPVSGGDAERLTTLEGSEYEARYRPDGKKIGFLHQGQLWEMNPDGSEPEQVTRIEGGIAHYKYSPDGKHIALVQEVKVTKNLRDRYPDLPKAEAYISDDLMYRHWDSWSDDQYAHVFIGKYANGQVSDLVDIMEGEPYDCPVKPFHGSDDFVWHPSGTSLVYVCKKETGKQYATSTNSQLYVYNVESGNTDLLTPGLEGYDTHPTFNEEGTQLAWLSMARNGYESDKNDILIAAWPDVEDPVNLTASWDGTVSSFFFSGKDKEIYYTADHEATVQLFSFEIETARGADMDNNRLQPRQITEGDHNLRGVLGMTGKTVVAGRTDMNHANELYTIQTGNGEMKALTHVNDKIYGSLKKSTIEKQWVETFDGKKMLVWVIFPPDFDPNKKYPTLLYCQGGPQSAVSQFYSFRWNFQLMAANDYIIIAPNRRGLPGFGTEWNEAISQDWGGKAMKDYLTAFDVISEKPYVDKSRTGAIGASYGGYSVYYLAGIHNNRFKSFISHCGLFNLESWYGSTEELFFANFDVGGPYWEEPVPSSYANFSPHKFAKNWNTPILVIHGGKDYRVPDTQGMEAFQVAQLKGLKSRFLYFPNEGHWVLSPQNGLVWHREFFGWLDETVKDL